MKYQFKMNFKKYIRRLLFKIQYNIVKKRLESSSNNLFSYPLIVYMTFNKEELYINYLNRISVRDSVIKELNKKQKLITKKINKINKKYSTEFYNRYFKWCERQRNIQEVKRYFGEETFDNIN